MHCELSYVGQTKCQLLTRIEEHSNYVKKGQIETSVIATHSFETGHSFNWNSVKILDIDKNYFKRQTSKMFFIKKQQHGLMMDTESLHDKYIPILDKIQY